MTNFRLLAVDIDGTLVNDQKAIPDVNRAALRSAIEAGMLFAIASGRMIPSIEPIAEKLGLDPIIIAYNGGKVIAPRSEGRVVIRHAPISPDVAEIFIRLSKDEGYLLNFYLDDEVYAEDGPSRRPFIDIYSRRTGAKYNLESDLGRFVGQSPTKLILLAAEEERDRLYARFREELAGRAFVTRSDPEYLEIMAPGVDKGSSLAAMAEHYDISVEEIVGVGDAQNDLELVRSAGLGVAVANASAELKDAADAVTERTNNEGAVAEVVETWFLGGKSTAPAE